MIKRITIDNFMSHTHTVIEPAGSLTVLTGPNNCGKSAVVAALQTICRDEKGSYMLRHGERESKVKVETTEGHSVEWNRKKSGSSSYILNGQSVHRVTPDNLHNLLSMPEVAMEDGSCKFDVHFGEQKKPIFLLDESGRHAATFFASSSDAEYIVRMQGLHRQKTSEARTLSKRLGEEILALESRIEKLVPATQLDVRLKDQEQAYLSLNAVRSSICSLMAGIQELQATSLDYSLREVRLLPVTDLREPPQQVPTIALQSQIESILAVTDDLEQVCVRLRPLENVLRPPELNNVGNLVQCEGHLSICTRIMAEANQMMENLSSLLDPPRVHDTDGLIEIITSLERSEDSLINDIAKVNGSRSLVLPPLLEDAIGLGNAISSLDRAFQDVSLCSGALVAFERLTPPVSLLDEQSLTTISNCLHDSMDEFLGAQSQYDILGKLKQPPKLIDYDNLITVCKDLKQAEKDCDQYRAYHTLAMDALSDQEGMARIWALTNPICSVCGQPINADILLKNLKETR